MLCRGVSGQPWAHGNSTHDSTILGSSPSQPVPGSMVGHQRVPMSSFAAPNPPLSIPPLPSAKHFLAPDKSSQRVLLSRDFTPVQSL